MPYDKPSDAPDHVPDDLKAQWVKIFNSVYEKEKSNGASDKDAEAKAFAEANGVIKKESKSMSTKTEYRAFATELRAKRDDGQPAKIEGYAAVFGQQADLGWFKESIRQGAFTRALKEKQDVRALFNHNPDHVLGRTTSGTLRLSEDEHGLRFEVDMPDTMMGQDVYKMIQRGDISQCSFGFRVNAEDVTYDDKGGATREITDADLFDVSPVTYPAYEQTSVEARSVAEYRTALDEARAEKAGISVAKSEANALSLAKAKTRLAEISLTL